MAELLIMTRDKGVLPGNYKRGDIVIVCEDGWPWGTKERLPHNSGGTFCIIKIPGLSVEKAEAYCAPEYALQDPALGMVKRRLWGCLIDNMPAGAKQTLASTGEYTTTVAAVKQFVRNKNTDTEADFGGA